MKDFPTTPKDVFKLGLKDWALYHSLITLFGWTGRWQYPAAASGDLETMSTRDKAYWLYKTTHPTKKAWKGSNLESFFEMQKNFVCQLPRGFEAKNELSFSAVGDLMSHPFLAHSQGNLYEKVSDLIFGADISMANLESVLHPSASGNFTFSTRSGPPLFYTPECFDIVKGNGKRKFTFMSTACNHSLDFGLEGVISTIQTLRSEDIYFHGINQEEKSAEMATVIEKNGFKIGMVSFTFGLNAHIPPKDKSYVVNRAPLNAKPETFDYALLKRQINFCQKAKTDFLIAHLHWGMEHEFYPRPEQIEVAHHLAEMGIDAIIGHHSHVIQPLEYYRTKRDHNRIVPIYYSLGNLINPFSAHYLCLGLIAQFALCKGLCTDGQERTYLQYAGHHEVRQMVDKFQKTISLALKKSTAIPNGIQIPNGRRYAA